MLSLHRASNTLKSRAFIIRTFYNSYPSSQVASQNLYRKASNGDFLMAISDTCTCLNSSRCAIHGSVNFYVRWCRFSSKAGSDNEEDDLEDGFSELETPPNANESSLTESDNESISEPELSEEENNAEEPHDGLLLSDSDELVKEIKIKKNRDYFALSNAILEAPGRSIQSALNKFVESGKEFDHTEVKMAMASLRRRNMHGRALQFSEWLESSKHIEFSERDYAARLDLIAKVRGIHVAESYIDKIPESFKTEVIYRTLLANCVVSCNAKKSEAVFNKMKDLSFPLSSFTCNQLLLLYKRTDKKKIADVLLLMEKENVKPTRFTYRLLIDTKGQSNDISGMEQIVETMKAEGMEPDLGVLTILAKHYVTSGLKEKAESVLKEMKNSTTERKWVAHALLPLYALLDMEDEVARVWEACKANPRLEDCIAAIEAWGRIGNVEEAEAAFEQMAKISKKLSSKHYSALLKVYANQKMVDKGQELVKRMAESGINMGPLIWDALVKLYVEVGDVEKADSILNKATQQRRVKPMFNSYKAVMDQYAQRGDVHNAEKIFCKLRQAGYVGRISQFESLIRAYVNAKVPAYGIRERMKADNIFPNKAVMGMLTKVDAFRKTPGSDLFD